MKYRAEIDGLRALAVVPVILFHAGFELFNGGFIGVDVFFVISGYLITTILIEDIEKKRFSLVNFYERRARRILPALFAMMLVCLPFSWMWMLPFQMKDFSQSLVAVSLFASNILFWRESGYFDAAAEEKPLLHTWSLAVEEQYYLLFPIFLIVVWRVGQNRVFWMVVAIAAFSLFLSEWGVRKWPSASFYLAPTRIWELCAGSIAAFIVHKEGIRKNDFLALLGLAAIVFSIFFYDESTPVPGIYALVPVVGVVLLILYAHKKTLAARVLSARMCVGVGLVSYSAYLWHQPLFAFARIKMAQTPSPSMMLILSLASGLLAFGSWMLVEKPFRTSAFNRESIFRFSLLGIFVFFSIGLVGHLTNGFDSRFTDDEKELLAFADNYKGRSERDYWNSSDKCYLISLPFEEFEKRDCFNLKFRDSSKTVLLIGDSHSGYLGEGLRPFLEAERINLLQLSISHCASLSMSGDTRCSRSLEKIRDLVRNEEIDFVVEFHTIGMEKYSSNPDSYLEEYLANLEYISENVEKVFVVGQIPTYRPSLPAKLVSKKFRFHNDRISFAAVSNESITADIQLRNVIEKSNLSNVDYISLFEELCDETSCLVRVGGDEIENLINWDYGHLSENGANYLSREVIGRSIMKSYKIRGAE